MKQVKWGFIGCGSVTEKKSGPAFSKIPGSTVVAVMRRDFQKAEDYARRHNLPRWYNDAAKLINDPEVNAIYIATPPGSHALYTQMAAKAKKPVYVEKPMALNFKECEEMIAVCNKNNVPLFVAYYRRYLDKFVKIKELLSNNRIGEIRTVHIKLHQPVKKEDFSQDWRVQPETSGGGYFYDLASHQLDLMDYFFGPIQIAKGFKENQAGFYEAEDNVTGVYRFESGILGTGSWCFTVAKELWCDQTEIIGSKGKISYVTFDDSPIILQTNSGIEEISCPYPEHVQQQLITAIVEDLMGREKCRSTGYSAARASKVMDMITGTM
ncbi:MAG: Gfo/Idh/MocA family oxidoreductase [Bacteroidota bacterium]|nr:Gfo/Idh/MocA family oxidoreductase [Bacteroidota bacterium]